MLPLRSRNCVSTSGALHLGGCQVALCSKPTKKLLACAVAAKVTNEVAIASAVIVFFMLYSTIKVCRVSSCCEDAVSSEITRAGTSFVINHARRFRPGANARDSPVQAGISLRRQNAAAPQNFATSIHK